MTQRVTFSLEAEAFAFLKAVAGNNKSAYINRLLKEEKQRRLEQDLLRANREEAGNAAYQEELSAWTETD